MISETFEGTFPGPWQVFDSNAELGAYYWNKRNCRPYQGGSSGWGVGGGDGAALACGSNYPDEVESWLVFGPFSLVNASDAYLNLQVWAKTELDYDYVFWGVSTDQITFYGESLSGDSAGWTSQDLDLKDVEVLGDLRGQVQVWLGIAFSSDAENNYPEGAYVDNIVLRQCAAPSCLPAARATAHEAPAGRARVAPAVLSIP